jgi:hypothetical protein
MKHLFRRLLRIVTPPGNRGALDDKTGRLSSEDPKAQAAKAYFDGQGGSPGASS